MTDRPVHQPECFDAPIPGRQWFAGCTPDQPRVDADGVCEECGGYACPVCGRENCPESASHGFSRAHVALVGQVAAGLVTELRDAVAQGAFDIQLDQITHHSTGLEPHVHRIELLHGRTPVVRVEVSAL